MDANKWVVFSRIIVWVGWDPKQINGRICWANFSGTRLIIKAAGATDSPNQCWRIKTQIGKTGTRGLNSRQ
jgi:hypothetical protein